MREIAAAILLGFLVLTAVAAWMGRYAVVSDNGAEFGQNRFYVTDRWSGTVYRCLSVGLPFGYADEVRQRQQELEGCKRVYPAPIATDARPATSR